MRSVGFGAVYSKGRQVYIYRKNCEILNQAFERKRLRTLKTSFRCVKSTNMSSMKQVVMGLSILNSFCYKRTSADLVFFFNELEQLSLVYELVFCRMKVLRWKDGPRFMSVQHLVRSYLQTLWLQSPEKYEYVQDLIEGNTHAYTILFDDIVSWNSARVRQENLLFSLAKIKKFNRHQFRKLEKLIRILTKYNQKVSKVHLLDFIGKVNRARPRESILSVLHGLFSYYQSLYKQEAFNRIKMATIKVSNDAEGKDKACRILGDIFSKRKYQTLSSIPYRSLFPISELNSYMESASVLGTSLNRLIKKRLADALQQIKHQSDESMSLQLTAERDLISTMETRYQKLLQRHADLLHSVVHRLFVQELCLPFRKLVWFGAQKKNFRDRLLNDLCNLFVKRYLAGFHAIRAEADFVLNQKLMYMREGFSILDMFAKNRINTAFSQIKTLLIELQTLQVADVTDSTKIMFKMKDILNTSGNMSGIDESINRGNQKERQKAAAHLKNANSRSTSKTRAGKNGREYQDTSHDASTLLKGDNSKMLHGVASTLSQDFTKSSSNQEMNIESRGVSSAAFGVAKAKVSQSKVITKEESSLGQTKKSATITSKQTSKHQETFGTGRFQSSAGGMEESAAEGNEFKRKGQMTMSSKKTEGQYGEERLGGQGAKVKKEVIRHGEGWDTKTITSKGTISETGHHLNFNATAYDNLTLDDSSKRAKVVKTKRLVTKTINTGNGLNTSGPHLK